MTGMATSDDELTGTNLDGVEILLCSDGMGHFFRRGCDRPACGAFVFITGEEHPADDRAEYVCHACVLAFTPS